MRRPATPQLLGGKTATPRLLSEFGAVAGLCFVSAHVMAFEEIPFDQLVPETVIEQSSSSMAYGHGALWIVSGFELARIDPSTVEVIAPDIEAMTSYPAFGIGEYAAWIAHVQAKALYKLDGASAEVLLKVPMEASYAQGTLAFGDGAVWLLTLGDNQELARVLSSFDTNTGAVRSRLELPAQSYGVAFANGSVWVTSQSKDELYQVDAAVNAILSTIPLGDRPGPIVVGANSLWVHNQGDGTVQGIDATTGFVAATIETSLAPGNSHVVFGGGYLWLTPDEGSPLIQIDPNSNGVIRSYDGAAPTGLAHGDGSLWVSERSRILRLVPPK